tara:strand:- start:173 stop:547 length:375 start_codon:yes stop_codon:yes gene_type:complete
MAYNLKIFNTPGAITLVTPPSMINEGKISFLLINLKEEQKNQFAIQLNKLFPNDNIIVYIYDDLISEAKWVKEASQRARFIVVDKTNLPIFVDEALEPNKVYEYTAEKSVESIFNDIKKTHFPE